jgi:hypothetical protein
MQVQRVAVAAVVRMAVEVALILVAAAPTSAAAEPISVVALRISAAAAGAPCRILPRMAHRISRPAALVAVHASPRTLLISIAHNFMLRAMVLQVMA